jgi:RimJ/RimL family protein N-acetyltransferase
MNEMYDAFEPKAMAQGLPPSRQDARRAWVSALMNRGVNFAAWSGEKVIGHASVLPDFGKRDGEYVIFILSAYRNRGLGCELTRMSVDKARTLSLTHLWLTVEVYNFHALRVYHKAGFGFCEEDGLERTMLLKL